MNLLNQISNASIMSSNSNSFRQLKEKCSNFTQIASTNTVNTSHHMYHTQKQDTDAEYLGRIKMALSINVVDPANIRKAHEELMTQVRTKAIHISNKYKIQIEPIQFEWDKFLPM